MKKIIIAVVIGVAAAGLVGVAVDSNANGGLEQASGEGFGRYTVHTHDDYTDGTTFVAGDTGTGAPAPGYGRYTLHQH